MNNDVAQELKENLRKIFETLPPELWCGMSTLLLGAACDVCSEYYGKGMDEVRKRFAALLARIYGDEEGKE